MKPYIRTTISLFFVLSISILAGQNSNSTNDRFPFEFNKRSKTSEVSLIWDEVYNNLYEDLMNTDYNIILHSYSSAIGKEEYNLKLSKDRGIAVKQFLAENGIEPSRIKFQQHIEDFIDETYAPDREVVPAFERRLIQTSQDYTDEFKNKETLDEDMAEGEEIFLNMIEPYVTAIKEGNHLQELPGVGRPSDDQDEFEDQATTLIKETVKAGKEAFKGNPKKLAKLVATYTLGSFIDLFTSNQTKIIAKNRKEMYDMIIEAFTNECFPNYQSDVMTSDYYSSSQQYLFAILSYEISNLSDLEKYQIRTRFISGTIHNSLSSATESKIRRFNTKMNSSSFFSVNMSHYFSQSKYRYRD
jgi:hypothetical protein